MGFEFFKKQSNKKDDLQTQLEKAGGIETPLGRIIGHKIDELELEKLRSDFVYRNAVNLNKEEIKDTKKISQTQSAVQKEQIKTETEVEAEEESVEVLKEEVSHDSKKKTKSETVKESNLEHIGPEEVEQLKDFEVIKSKLPSKFDFTPFEFARFLLEQKLNNLKSEAEKQEYRKKWEYAFNCSSLDEDVEKELKKRGISLDCKTEEEKKNLKRIRLEIRSEIFKGMSEHEIKEVREKTKKMKKDFFVTLIKEVFTGIAVHKNADLDANGIIFLSKKAGLNFSKFNSELESGSISYLDNSIKYKNEDGSINEDIVNDLPKYLVADLSQTDGLNVYKTKGPRYLAKYFMATLDHHAFDSKKGNSATKQMFELLLKLGSIREGKEDLDFMKEMVDFINREDDKFYNFENYKMTSKDFKSSHRTLYGYISLIKNNNLEKIYNCESLKNKFLSNDPRIPLEFIELSDEELQELGLINTKDDELIAEYNKEFKKDIKFPEDIIRLEKIYWEERKKLKRSGEKKESIELKLQSSTGLGWLMERSKKIELFVKNRKDEYTFDKYTENKKEEKELESNRFGKIFIGNDVVFNSNPTNLLICKDYDGYVNYTNDGKVFRASFFKNEYPEFDKDFMNKLEANGIIRMRGMLIKVDNKSIVSEDFYNEILEKIKTAEKSLTEEEEEKEQEDSFETINDPYLYNSEKWLDFLNNKEALEECSKKYFDDISKYSFNENFKDFSNRLKDISENIVSFRKNIQTFRILNTSESFEPYTSLEMEGKKFYLSKILKEKNKEGVYTNNNSILCYVDDGENIYPRLFSLSEIGVGNFRSYISSTSKKEGYLGKELLFRKDNKTVELITFNEAQITKLNNAFNEKIKSMSEATLDINKTLGIYIDKYFSLVKNNNRQDELYEAIKTGLREVKIEKFINVEQELKDSVYLIVQEELKKSKESAIEGLEGYRESAIEGLEEEIEKGVIKLDQKEIELEKIDKENEKLEKNIIEENEKLEVFCRKSEEILLIRIREIKDINKDNIDKEFDKIINSASSFIRKTLMEKKQNPYMTDSYTIEEEIIVDEIEEFKKFTSFDSEKIKSDLLKEIDNFEKYEIPIMEVLEHFDKNIFNIFKLDELEIPKGLTPDFKSDFVSRYIFDDLYFGRIVSETFSSTVNNKKAKIVFMVDKKGEVWIDDISYEDPGITTYGTNKTLIPSGILTTLPLDKKQDNLVMQLIGSMYKSLNEIKTNFKEEEFRKIYSKFIDIAFKVFKEVGYNKNSDYIDITKFLENLKIIQDYEQSDRYKKAVDVLNNGFKNTDTKLIAEISREEVESIFENS